MKDLKLSPLEEEVWQIYQNNNNSVKATARQLNRQPEQIRKIVARLKTKINRFLSNN